MYREPILLETQCIGYDRQVRPLLLEQLNRVYYRYKPTPEVLDSICSRLNGFRPDHLTTLDGCPWVYTASFIREPGMVGILFPTPQLERSISIHTSLGISPIVLHTYLDELISGILTHSY